jgi:hypothetical protein
MSFFRRLFRGEDDKQRFPQLTLRLKYPPTPEFAANLANIAVTAARNVSGIELDYSPESLSKVDAIVNGFHQEGLKPSQIGETVFTFGCYVGEVFVRNDDGVWKMPSDTNLPDAIKDNNNMMVVVLPKSTVCNPIGKAFKLLELGESESLAYFYQVMRDS